MFAPATFWGAESWLVLAEKYEKPYFSHDIQFINTYGGAYYIMADCTTRESAEAAKRLFDL